MLDVRTEFLRSQCISRMGSLVSGTPKELFTQKPGRFAENPPPEQRPVASSLLRSTTVSAQARTVAAANAHGDVSGAGPESQR